MTNDNKQLRKTSSLKSKTSTDGTKPNNDQQAQQQQQQSLLKASSVTTKAAKKTEKNNDDDDDDLKSRCGFFRKAIPIMPKSLAIVCCILNILFPGLGKQHAEVVWHLLRVPLEDYFIIIRFFTFKRNLEVLKAKKCNFHCFNLIFFHSKWIVWPDVDIFR